MHINSISDQTPFTTKDGSTITSILDESNAPVQNQSLAEATLPAKGSTQRHYHKKSEEFYYLLEGEAQMEIDGVTKKMSSGDAVLIPAGAWHQITANEDGKISEFKVMIRPLQAINALHAQMRAQLEKMQEASA